MPDAEQAHLVFPGPTILARAFCTVEKAGYGCTIISAPAGGSPCGLALAVRAADLPRVLETLHAVGIKPYRSEWSEAAGASPRV